MDSGTKAKAGLIGGGVLAAIIGLVGDCGQAGMRSARHVDDIAGAARLGDELAGAGSAARNLDELDELIGLTHLHPGVPARDETLIHLTASGWDDFERILDTGQTTVEVGLNASDLLVEEYPDPEQTPLPELLLRVRGAEVAAIMPPYEDAAHEERELREDMTAAGVELLDSPSSLGEVLEHSPRPLLIVARMGSTEGTLRAPDGSDVEVRALLTYCASAHADGAALVCNTEDVECLRAAQQVALATVAANQTKLPDFYRALLSGRYAAGEAGTFDIFRLAEGRLVRSDGATGPETETETEAGAEGS